MHKIFNPLERYVNKRSLLLTGLLILLCSTLISACRLELPGAATVAKAAGQAITAYEKTHCFVDLPQGVTEGKDAVCGYVSVPQHHGNTQGKKLRLAVVIIKSTQPHPDPTPLVMANGGPGGTTIASFLSFAATGMTDIRAQRDIILVDYRGTGFSQPELSCPQYDSLGLQGIFMPVGNHSEEQQTALRTCLDSFIKQDYDLSAFNSVEIAADYPTVLNALGYKQFHFYGVSYGTEFGQYLMREAPGSLRSVVLDSVVPVSVNYRVTVPASADRVLRMIFKNCAADARCRQTYPNLEKTFLNLVDTLNNKPVMIPVDAQGTEVKMPFNGDTLINVLFEDLYSSAFTPEVPALITSMAKGDETVIQPLLSEYLVGFPGFASGLQVAVDCAEYPDPASADYHLNGLYPQVAQAMEDTNSQCQIAKVKALDNSVRQPVASAIPVLALSGNFDPITPPPLADIAIAKMSHAYHYTFPAEGHGEIFTNTCALSMMTNFIANPQQRPDSGCLQQQKPPAFGNAIALIPYVDKQNGFTSVVPNSWTESTPGSFSDFGSTRSINFVVSSGTITINDFLKQFGVDSSQKKVMLGKRSSHGVEWQLYRVQGDSTASAYIALATTKGSTYAIMVSAYPQDIDQLVTDLFYPAIAAFQVR